SADLEELAEKPVDVNPKGDLQELLQGISPHSPIYELISQSGPEHEKTFVSQVVWEGTILGKGTGHSKKQAETAAALEALQLKRSRTSSPAQSLSPVPSRRQDRPRLPPNRCNQCRASRRRAQTVRKIQ